MNINTNSLNNALRGLKKLIKEADRIEEDLFEFLDSYDPGEELLESVPFYDCMNDIADIAKQAKALDFNLSKAIKRL